MTPIFGSRQKCASSSATSTLKATNTPCRDDSTNGEHRNLTDPTQHNARASKKQALALLHRIIATKKTRRYLLTHTPNHRPRHSRISTIPRRRCHWSRPFDPPHIVLFLASRHFVDCVPSVFLLLPPLAKLFVSPVERLEISVSYRLIVAVRPTVAYQNQPDIGHQIEVSP